MDLCELGDSLVFRDSSGQPELHNETLSQKKNFFLEVSGAWVVEHFPQCVQRPWSHGKEQNFTVSTVYSQRRGMQPSDNQHSCVCSPLQTCGG